MTRAPTSMERRVAAALAERAGLVPNDGAIERHLGDARAVIRCMGEPSEDMADIIGADILFGDSTFPDKWRDAIDAASPPDAP